MPHTRLTTDPIPVYHLDSGRPGPGLLIHAVRHGNELSGAEVARRFVLRARRELQRGRVVVVPVASPLALHARTYTYQPPEGPNQVSRWPGRPDGDDSERLIHRLREVIDEPSLDVCVDIHCGEPAFASWAIERIGYAPARELADLCAFRIIRPSEPIDWTPTGYFNSTGRAGVTLELSGTYEITEREVRRGLRACLNIARHLGMMPGEIELDPPSLRVAPDDLVPVKAGESGLHMSSRPRPGDLVRAGQTVCRLLRERDWRATAIKAPVGGILHTLGPNRPGAHNNLQARHAYVEPGEALAEIAPLP